MYTGDEGELATVLHHVVGKSPDGWELEFVGDVKIRTIHTGFEEDDIFEPDAKLLIRPRRIVQIVLTADPNEAGEIFVLHAPKVTEHENCPLASEGGTPVKHRLMGRACGYCKRIMEDDLDRLQRTFNEAIEAERKRRYFL